MDLRIRIVDPVEHAAAASEILLAAWKPPCLHYSPEYLSWQFSFPGPLPRVAAMAFLGDRPAGCIGTTIRQFAHAQTTFPCYVLSFAAVAPFASRRGLGAAMYAALLEALPDETPVVAFAEPDSVGERLLLNAFARTRFRYRSMRSCQAVGYIHRAKSESAAFAHESAGYQEFVSAHSSSAMEGTLWMRPTAGQWEHYRSDPRERSMVTIHKADNNPLGTAMVVATELVTPDGLMRVPMVESVALTEPSADALAAVFRFAAERCQPGTPVIASNLSHIDSRIARAAGARAVPSAFATHAFVKGRPHAIEGASALNLEVI